VWWFTSDAAPSTALSSAGSGASRSTGTHALSANPPPMTWPTTGSPCENTDPGGADSTAPATSSPGMNGVAGLTW